MQTRWQFKVIIETRSFFVCRDGSRRVLNGTDEDALKFAAKIHEHFASREPKHVEAWSISAVDFSVADALLERVQFRLRHRSDGMWQFEETALMHPAVYPVREHAVEYAAFRGRGYCCEIRILDWNGTTENVVLFRGGNDPFGRAAPIQGNSGSLETATVSQGLVEPSAAAPCEAGVNCPVFKNVGTIGR